MRATLAEILAQTVSAVYARRREYQYAKDRGKTTMKFSFALKTALDKELVAERAYNDHIEEHGCRS